MHSALKSTDGAEEPRGRMVSAGACSSAFPAPSPLRLRRLCSLLHASEDKSVRICVTDLLVRWAVGASTIENFSAGVARS